MGAMDHELVVLQNQALALVYNLLSWFISTLPKWLQPPAPPAPKDPSLRCVVIRGPGGLERLEVTNMGGDREKVDDGATIGYNLPGLAPPFISGSDLRRVCAAGEDGSSAAGDFADLARDLVLVRTSHFSVNYADVTIRWGLYESALRFVGWPIVPGFDLSGVVEWAGSASGLAKGDRVFGFTMFGAYSTRVLVPARQLMRTPASLKDAEAGALPAAAGTALHAVSLAGLWPPSPARPMNRTALVHSASGGVGSMLCMMLKLVGCEVVGVVGRKHKEEGTSPEAPPAVRARGGERTRAEADPRPRRPVPRRNGNAGSLPAQRRGARDRQV